MRQRGRETSTHSLRERDIDTGVYLLAINRLRTLRTPNPTARSPSPPGCCRDVPVGSCIGCARSKEREGIPPHLAPATFSCLSLSLISLISLSLISLSFFLSLLHPSPVRDALYLMGHETSFLSLISRFFLSPPPKTGISAGIFFGRQTATAAASMISVRGSGRRVDVVDQDKTDTQDAGRVGAGHATTRLT